jgi:CRP/FNR family cyclic AMP-dependent transcriptional regulator
MATSTVTATAALPGFRIGDVQAKTHSPYGLPIIDGCQNCKLRNNNSFCSLSPETVKALDQLKHVTSYPEEALVFVEGQTANGIYIICQGRAKLTTTNAEGKTLMLRIAEAGEILGLNSCISGRPQEFTVETLQPCQLAFVSRDQFLRFLNQHGDACLQAAQHLSRDCQSAYNLLRSIALSHSVGEKLARLVLEWAGDQTVASGTIRVKVTLTHEEIAQLVCSSRESVTRTLSEFKRKNILELKGSTLVVKNKAALQQLAGC